MLSPAPMHTQHSDVHSPHTDVSHCHALSLTHTWIPTPTVMPLWFTGLRCAHSDPLPLMRSGIATLPTDTPFTRISTVAPPCALAPPPPPHTAMSQRPSALHLLLIAAGSHSSLTHPSFMFTFFRFGRHVPAPILFIISQILLVSNSWVTKQRQGPLCGPHTTGPVHTGTCHGAPTTEGCEQLLISLFRGNNLELEPYRVTHAKSIRRKMTPVRFSFVFFNNMGFSCLKA